MNVEDLVTYVTDQAGYLKVDPGSPDPVKVLRGCLWSTRQVRSTVLDA